MTGAMVVDAVSCGLVCSTEVVTKVADRPEQSPDSPAPQEIAMMPKGVFVCSGKKSNSDYVFVEVVGHSNTTSTLQLTKNEAIELAKNLLIEIARLIEK